VLASGGSDDFPKAMMNVATGWVAARTPELRRYRREAPVAITQPPPESSPIG
jgi:hypothetical protein